MAGWWRHGQLVGLLHIETKYNGTTPSDEIPSASGICRLPHDGFLTRFWTLHSYVSSWPLISGDGNKCSCREDTEHSKATYGPDKSLNISESMLI